MIIINNPALDGEQRVVCVADEKNDATRWGLLNLSRSSNFFRFLSSLAGFDSAKASKTESKEVERVFGRVGVISYQTEREPLRGKFDFHLAHLRPRIVEWSSLK